MSYDRKCVYVDFLRNFVQVCFKVASYFLPQGKNKYETLGKRLLWKYIRQLKLVYQK